MRNWILGGLAVAIVIGAAMLLWSLQSGGETPVTGPTRSESPTDEAASTPSPRPEAVRAGAVQPGTQPRASTGDPAQLRPEERTMEFERLLASEVPGRIREAAVHCFDGGGYSYKQLENSDKSVDFDYTLRLKDGVVSLQDVKLTKEIGTSTDGCVMQAVSRLSWRDTVNPDFTMDMSDSITLLELKKWGEPMPHEIEEIPEEPPEDEE